MGKFLDPKAKKPKVAHGYAINFRHFPLMNLYSRYSGSPTFYKLHGFVTQKDGNYMCYTRRISGSKWYKIEDMEVLEAEMATYIESRGVSCLVYRLQDFH